MQTNLIPVAAARQHQPVTPEIDDALKTAWHIKFRLEAEYFALDWESRLELAEELYALCDDLTDEQADVIARVASDLESDFEDFSRWETRADAASRVRTVIRSLEREGVFA